MRDGLRPLLWPWRASLLSRVRAEMSFGSGGVASLSHLEECPLSCHSPSLVASGELAKQVVALGGEPRQRDGQTGGGRPSWGYTCT